MADQEEYDVIIVGAGPAGSMLAYELASRSLKVCLIEKEKLPRYKPCGGGLTNRVIELLRFDISHLIESTISAITFSRKFKDSFTKEYHKPLIHMVMRDKFDLFLTEQAIEKGTILVNSKVVEAIKNKDNVHVKLVSGEIINGKILVGADGALGIVARQFNFTDDFLYDVALENEISVDQKIFDKMKNRILIDWGLSENAYAWVFPKKSHLSVGVGGPVSNGNIMESFYDKWITYNGLPALKENIKGHPIKFRVSATGSRISSERVLLIGEAAGLVDYWTGEGIYYAIRSALLAAPVIKNAIKEENFGFEEYDQIINKEIMADLETAWKIANIISAFHYPIHKAARYFPKLWNAYCKIITGEKRYRDFKKYVDKVQLLMKWFGKKAK